MEIPAQDSAQNILCIDIGGSNIKTSVINAEGQLIVPYTKVPTPIPSSPAAVTEAIRGLIKSIQGYEKIAVGFPGYVKQGIIHTAPNLGTELWEGTDFAKMLASALGKPVRVVNDADMLGLGIVSGKGFEMVVTLGTGFGTAFTKNGILLPHLEVAHHIVAKDKTYDEYIGEAALIRKGEEQWNHRMKKVFVIVKRVFNYDTLYIGGGNAKKLNFPLDGNMKLFTNKEGIKGGYRLWQLPEEAL